MSGVTLIVCLIRLASECHPNKRWYYSNVCFGTKLLVNANHTRVGIIIALFFIVRITASDPLNAIAKRQDQTIAASDSRLLGRSGSV